MCVEVLMIVLALKCCCAGCVDVDVLMTVLMIALMLNWLTKGRQGVGEWKGSVDDCVDDCIGVDVLIC
jgi:hypothetical protein